MAAEEKRPTRQERVRRTPADPIRPLSRLVGSTMPVQDIVTRPLWCVRPEMRADDALDAMNVNGFDIAGVAEHSVTHFVERSELATAGPQQRVKHLMKAIPVSWCVERTLPIASVLDLLVKHRLLFVLEGSDVRWLVNHSDLSASAVSIAVLAHLAAVEEGLKQIAATYEESVVVGAMSKGYNEAMRIFEEQKASGTNVSVLDCFSFGDWMSFVRAVPELKQMLGYPENKITGLTYTLKALRDNTAHGRGILAGASTPATALRNVTKALDFARRVWRIVDELQPKWDRFAESRIVFANSRSRPISGAGARQTWPWGDDIVHVLTASNPSGIWCSDEKNAAANSTLEEFLRRRRVDYERVVCRSEVTRRDEESLLVHGLKRHQAADIGRAFGQTAVFELDRNQIHVIRCEDAYTVRSTERRRPSPPQQDRKA